MCLSCGCKRPDDAHGDPRHITWEVLQQAAKAVGVSPKKAAKNIRKTVKRTIKAAQVADAREVITDVN